MSPRHPSWAQNRTAIMFFKKHQKKTITNGKPNLIIGHTTHESTMIWVRGDKVFNRVEVTVEGDVRGIFSI